MNNLLEKINNWVGSGPAGNDKQFNPLPYIQLGLGLISTYMAANQSTTSWDDKEDALDKMFSGTKGLIGNLTGRAGNLFDYGDKVVGKADELYNLGAQYHDPQSKINQDSYNQIQENTLDVATANALNANRFNNSLGVVGRSGGQSIGIANTMNKDFATKINQVWQNYKNQSRTTGNQLYGNATSLYGTGNNIYGSAGSMLNAALGAQSSLDSAYMNAQIGHWAQEDSMGFDFFSQLGNSLLSNAGAGGGGGGTTINNYLDGQQV